MKNKKLKKINKEIEKRLEKIYKNVNRIYIENEIIKQIKIIEKKYNIEITFDI